MGAWFILGFAPDQVGGGLLAALERSRGSLTAPPLAIACALVLGRDAGLALANYVERDTARDGSAAFVAAVHELFCGTSPVYIPDRDRAAVAAMQDVGQRLRSALTAE